MAGEKKFIHFIVFGFVGVLLRDNYLSISNGFAFDIAEMW